MKRIIITLMIGLILLGSSFALLLGRIRATASSTLAGIPTAPIQKTETNTKTPEPTRVEGTPVKLDVPSLDLSLSIVPGTYNEKTRTWTLTTNKVQYATVTPKPNNIAGNTFMYGHYRSNVFAPLRKIKANETAVVTADNGHVFYYQLSSVRIVTPEDSAGVFADSNQPTLTLQTCTGLFYEKRQLFVFDLQRVV